MDIKKSFQEYDRAKKQYDEAARKSIQLTSKYEEAKLSLKAAYIAEETANAVIGLYDKAQAASDTLDAALVNLDMAKADLLEHLAVINHVPVVVQLETGAFLVEAKRKDEQSAYELDYTSFI
jgi:hypothetical protein